MRLSRKLRKRCAPWYCAEAMEPRVLLAASMVQDLNISWPFSQISTLGHIGSVVIFSEDDVVHGSEPYRTDGTKAGTVLLGDINPGSDGSDASGIATIGKTLFFSANNGKAEDLWKTDGTVTGTVKLADVNPTTSHVVVGNELFFVGIEHIGKQLRSALWKSDGTSAGTIRITDNIESIHFYRDFDNHMGTIGGKIFFAADDVAHGTELWRSDGTAAGTKFFADLFAGPASSKPFDFVATRDRLYFLDNIEGSTKQHLWKTDGNSVKLVETVGNRNNYQNSIANLTRLGTRLYFVEHEKSASYDFDSVWRTTGKGRSLRRLARFEGPEILSADPSGPRADRIYVGDTPLGYGAVRTFYSVKDDTLTPVAAETKVGNTIDHETQIGNDLYFITRAGNVTRASVEEGQVLLKRLPGALFDDFVAVGSKVYFAVSSQHGQFTDFTSVLWLTDGTAVNTVKEASFPGGGPSSLSGLVAGGRLYFAAESAPVGAELWVSDGSPTGTHLIRDIDPRTDGSAPSRITPGVGGAYFIGRLKEFGVDTNIFFYNESTRKITQVLAPSTDELPFIGELGNSEIFVLDHAIFRSDGTKAGTKKIFSSTDALGDAAIAGGTLYFDDHHNLFKSDGTASGTMMLKSGLHFASRTVNGIFLRASVTGVALNQSLIFEGDSVASGQSTTALWITNGTANGTTMISNLNPSEYFNFSNAVYFFVDEKATKSQDLWNTDGTAKGTKLVKAGFGFGSDGNRVAVTPGSFYIYNGLQLWSSDGTASGTKLLKQFVGKQAAPSITAVGNRVYFSGYDSIHGFGLWSSVGGKIALVKAISPASDLVAAPDGKVYFAADDGVHGWELWESDGTANGTKLVQDIAPGMTSSFAQELTVTDRTLLFDANDGIHGHELWQLPLG